MQSLLKNCETQRVMNAVAAGTSNQNSSGVKMDDCEGVKFSALLGTLTSTAVTGLKLQQSDDDGSADDYTDIEGSAVAIADTQSNKIAEVEIYRPTKLWVRAVVTRGTANAVIDGVVAQKYGLKKKPHSAHTSVVSTSKTLAGPAEGTA